MKEEQKFPIPIFRAESGGGAPRLVRGQTMGAARAALVHEYRANLVMRRATQQDLVELLPATPIESVDELRSVVDAEVDDDEPAPAAEAAQDKKA